MGPSPENLHKSHFGLFARIVLPALAILTILFFQNCGSAKHTTNLVEASQGPAATGYLALEDQAKQNTAFRVALAADVLESGSEAYWSAIYLAGGSCTQTLSATGSEATFMCPNLGSLAVRLVTTAPDGSLKVYDLALNVGDGVTGTPPTPTPTPLPAPAPMPVPTPGNGGPDGAALYAANCAGCHGPLATSAKHGIVRSQLDLGIATVGAMTGLSGLTSVQRDAIVQALK